MELFQGTEGFGEVALGTIKVLKKNIVTKNISATKEDAIAEYEIAKQRAIEMISHEKDMNEHSTVLRDRDNSNLDSQLMLISDHQFEDVIIARIYNNNLTAREAIVEAGKYLTEILSEQSDEYLRSKASDIEAITRRMVACLDDYRDVDAYLPDNCIVAVKELSSSEFLKLDKDKLKGLIIEEATSNSHAVILSKALDIPTIVGCDIQPEWDGKTGCVDGGWRVLYLEPDEATIQDMHERIDEANAKQQRLLALKGKECVTRDGRVLHVYANIARTIDVQMAIDNDAEGIGLYRTESSFLNRKKAPSEEELFYEYRSLAMALGTKGVTIRTVDLSSNNDIPYVSLTKEENSALGLRGIRFCFKYMDIFKAQIRAVLKAAAYGNLSIMFPMISSIKEFDTARELVDRCYHEMISADIPCKMVKVGVMIETPAAVMISDELAKHADFISIGTNDLTQYTIGVDRENKAVADICDYRHPAILKMIKIVSDNAHRYNVPVGISGELAYDEQLLSYYLETGIDSLSVSPAKILQLRDYIIKL